VTPALALLGYAVCAAWCAPAVLAPLTRRGASVRVGLAGWLAAMASVLASAAISLQLSFITVAANWPTLTQALCRSVAGSACTSAVYRSALYEAGVGVFAIAGAVIALVAAWRFARRVDRARSRTAAHAAAARIVGRDLALFPGTTLAADTVVLDDPRPAAYCVAGRPAAIVVTTGSLAVLDRDQLDAVLAHERAHLACRHHVLTAIAQGLASAFPGVPVFTQGVAEVSRLTEMAADDAAARSAGRPALIAALLAIATGVPVPARSLGAAAFAVPARVERLLRPSRPAVAATVTSALALTLTALTLIPVALATLT
jgi:Zn-dependent protease with chaperone function